MPSGVDQRQRFGRIPRFQRDIAERMELGQYIIPDQLVVLDYQDRFIAAAQ